MGKDAPQYEGIDQTVLLNFQTLSVMCTPETVVKLYNIVTYIFSENSKNSNSTTYAKNRYYLYLFFY